MKNNIMQIIYLGALSAFAPSSTDIYLASMPGITTVFHTTAAMVQLTLSLFFVGFAFGQLLWGPLSDRVGRKAVIVAGVTIFIVASFLCAWSQSISMLIFARILQSIGACSGIVMAISIVKDSFTDSKKVAKVISSIMAAAIIAPMIAPIVGSFLLTHFNWRANFYFLACYGILLLFATLKLKETHAKHKRKVLSTKKLLAAYSQQAMHKPFLIAALSVGTSFSTMFAFIASSSFIYIKIYGVTPHVFAFLFAINASSLIIGSIISGKLKEKFSEKTVLSIALIILFTGLLGLFVLLLLAGHTAVSIVIPSFFITLAVSFIFPEMTAQALTNVIEYNGLASSLIGSIRFIIAAVIGYLMGLLISSSAWPLAMTMAALSFLTLFFLIAYSTLKKRRRCLQA